MMKIEDLTRANVKSLKPYSSARDEFKAKAEVYLDANESPFENGLNRYPDPYQKELKKVLASIKNTDPECMVLGNGSDEILDLIIRAFCEPGKDNVIIVPPTYGMYKVLAETNGVEVKEVWLNEDFTLDVDRILAATDEQTKVLFLASPNNPTGNSFAEEDVIRLLNEMNALVVVDEAYIEFSDKESWVKQIDNHVNLIVTQTLSKAYGMAGIRLGMALAQKEVVDTLNKIKYPYNVSVLTQRYALDKLQQKKQIEKQLKVILNEKERLKKSFETFDFVEKVFQSDANFWLVRVRDADHLYRFLLERGVVVRNRSKEPLCEQTLRITVGTPDDNSRLLAVLAEYEKLNFEKIAIEKRKK